MNAAICWKEYRQQRGLWVAVAALALLLAIAIGASVGRGSGLAVFQDERVRSALIWIGYSMAIAYGLACGALLLAEEKENTTLVFLDTLPAARQVIWEAKVASGFLLSISEGLLLAAVVLWLGSVSWELALYVPLLSADALIWGLVGGALCRNVLLAVLTGIGLMAVSWVLPLPMNWAPVLFAMKIAFAILGVLLSRRFFCEPDRNRGIYTQRLGQLTPRAEPGLKPWRVMMWLIVRQGRWVLVALVPACVGLGFAVNRAPLILYPAATLIVGLVCGLATFVPEQSGRHQNFLGGQRFPPGRIWMYKICFWAVAAIVFTAFLWFVAVGTSLIANANAVADRGLNNFWQENWGGRLLLDVPLFLSLWPIYGFCVGQFCAIWAARPVIAAILAAVLGIVLSLLWLPSVLFGGVYLWQVLGVPVLLLLGTRLFFWRWLTGQLYTLRSWLGLSSVSLAAVLWLVAGLWYRILEIPDVGKPSAVREFIMKAPALEKSEASVLIRRAGVDCIKDLAKLNAEAIPRKTEVLPFGPPAPAPLRPPLPNPPVPPGGVPGSNDVPNSHRRPDYYSLLHDVLRDGWPKGERDLARWLDKVCGGPWFKDAQRAARLPLGMVQDPRPFNADDAVGIQQERPMVIILNARALQFITFGTTQQALEQIEMNLGISRQLRNYAPAASSNYGNMLEWHALTALETWLAKAHPDAEQVRQALLILECHEQQRPGKLQARVTAYVVAKNYLEIYPGKVFGANTNLAHPSNRSVWRSAWGASWERTRQERLGDLVSSVWLQEADKPYWELREFPPCSGPDTQWCTDHWERLFFRSWPMLLHTIYADPPIGLTELRGHIVTTALVLYQAERGKLPSKLDALVPDCLSSLPLDPFTGKSFHYRISNGETIAADPSAVEKKELTLARGQAVVWSEGKGIYGVPEPWSIFPVPIWKRAD
jgi:hypothetical protein